MLVGLKVSSFAQQIHISADNKTLSEILITLRDQYSLSFSFNDAELRKYIISIEKDFESTEEALNHLLRDLPLSYEKSGNVYVIFPQIRMAQQKQVNFILSGRIVERKSLEPLPYSSVIINGKGSITDENGFFHHRSGDSVFHLQASHLGYYKIDTVLTPEEKHLIRLIPAIERLEEVVITDRLLETFLYSENQAGVLRMNHKITRFLPGSCNNSVFNLLRLQSGITASAEALENLIIWGSYEGQSRILFDDILLFGLQNFNDNIGTVNPYVVKDIKLMKAAYESRYGDCVGGIAEITGKVGNQEKLSMDLSLNNYTINSMLETPLSQNSSLIIAFRHTYRNLYEPIQWDLTLKDRINEQDVTLVPDYIFRDMNLKYAFRNEQDLYLRLSMLAGQDNFSYNIEEMVTRMFRLERNTSETSLQKGASLVIGKNGNNGLSAKLGMSFSGLDSRFENEQKIINTINNNRRSASQQTFNSTTEAKVNVESSWTINSTHHLETGLSWVGNHSQWIEDTSGENFINQNIDGYHVTLMVQDRIAFENFKLVPGIRLTRVPDLQKTFLAPRISAAFEITKVLNFSLAAGIHHQYLTENSVEDEYGNYRYLWTVANDSEYPVLNSKHFTASFTLDKNNTQAIISPYYKITQGLTRYVNFRFRDIEAIYEGHGESYGLDFYLKQNFNEHTAWISYTFSETQEWFEYFPSEDYRYAPHDQRHEVKLAIMANFDPVYFSANYVYGSGFPNRNVLDEERFPYHRLDLALTSKFNFSAFYGEAGLFVLNVFDRENLLHYNLERVPSFQTSTIKIYQQSVPFTPTLFLRIGF
ncbi:MAG: FecR domain-containing protein [Bacteroidota bacterium]